MEESEIEEGDCEECQYYIADLRTCLYWLDETYSYESCPAWKKKATEEEEK